MTRIPAKRAQPLSASADSHLSPEPLAKRRKGPCDSHPTSDGKRCNTFNLSRTRDRNDANGDRSPLEDKASGECKERKFMALNSVLKSFFSLPSFEGRSLESIEWRISGSSGALTSSPVIDESSATGGQAQGALHQNVHKTNCRQITPPLPPAHAVPSPHHPSKMNYPSITNQHQSIAELLWMGDKMSLCTGTDFASRAIGNCATVGDHSISMMHTPSSSFFEKPRLNEPSQQTHPTLAHFKQPDVAMPPFDEYFSSERVCGSSSSSPSEPFTPDSDFMSYPEIYDLTQEFSGDVYGTDPYPTACQVVSSITVPSNNTLQGTCGVQDYHFPSSLAQGFHATSEAPPCTDMLSNRDDWESQPIWQYYRTATEILTQGEEVGTEPINAREDQPQPVISSLPPAAFMRTPVNASAPTVLILHHPRPRRPYVPWWQREADFDLDQLLKLPVPPPDSHVQSMSHHSAYSIEPSVDEEDMDIEDADENGAEDESEEELELDLMDEDEGFYEEEMNDGRGVEAGGDEFYHYWNDPQSRHIEVGPSIGLGSGPRSLGSLSLLCQSVPDTVKYCDWNFSGSLAGPG